MIIDIYHGGNSYKWFGLHMLLGIFCILSPKIIIFWFYIILILSLNKIISDWILRSSVRYLFPLTIYLASFEVFARLLGSSPFIPWELSKYLILFISFLNLFFLKYQMKSFFGFLLFLLLIPGIIIDSGNNISLNQLAYNVLGPMSIACLLIIFEKDKITETNFNSFLKLIWFSSISLLIYVAIETPDISKLNFSLNANFQATGGFGSNQIATILGLGMFLSFYAWMNKLEFSGSHRIDGFFIFLFAYQGFLSFSRGGMLVGIFCILIYYLLLIRSDNYEGFTIKRKLKPATFFGIGLFFIFSSYFIINIFSEGNINYRYLGETETTLSGEKIKTLNTITTGRYEIMEGDLELWKENFIFGTGVGSSKLMRNNGLDRNASHNEFTRLLAEHGIFGFLYIFILLIFFFRLVFLKKRTVGNAIVVTLFMIGVGTMVHSGMRTFVSPIFIALSSMIITENKENDIF